MKKQGAIVLGSGGDCCASNTNLSEGTFYEGVIVSGYPSAETLSECEQLGITDFLTKPFEMTFVQASIEKILKTKAGMAPVPAEGNA